MTPGYLWSSEPLYGDRPYASLFFVTASQIRLLAGGDRARFSSFTVGLMGMHAAEEMHRFVHKALGNKVPQGWGHQISDGGEPTARYVQAGQWLLSSTQLQNTDRPELKLTVAGSAGFITEGSVAFSTRWGRIQSPWWSFAPELGDYTAAPLAPVEPFSSGNPAEMFAFAGLRLKARAYNALLEGQFRRSDVRVHGDDLEHVQAEAWLGFATTWSGYRIAYTLRYATPELATGPGRRGPVWAGITFERTL
jgi:hypothetical protein